MKPRGRPTAPAESRPRLPRERTTFVGREADIAAIRRLFEDGAQLVTLLGPPGIGKTRLSLQVARSLGGDATFCDLVEARDRSAVLTAAAIALGVSVEAPMSDEALARLIGRALDQRGEALLVLDNAEQIARDVAALAALWLDLAPAALLLVTSRERLRIPGEHALVLGPLGVPPARETSPEALLASEAVTLLCDRARAARAAFSASPEDAAALAEIVRRVEGVPLAIELCAARLGVLAPRQLLARLALRLDILATDLRGAPERQAHLRGAIDWSWNLLDERERSALAQTSVFRGGFDLDAAEAVLDLGAPAAGPAVLGAPAAGPVLGAPAAGPAVLDALAALHDKSLVASDAEGDARAPRRYRLYESLREYAAEKLAERPDGAAERAADRHARHFADAGARWAAAARGRDFSAGLAALARESGNLEAAGRWAAERGDLDQAMEIALCLEPLAIVRGPVMPYLSSLEAALATAGDRLSPRTASRAFGSLGVAESRVGRPGPAIASFQRAVELATASGDVRSLPFLLAKLGNQHCVTGDQAAAEEAFRRARELLDANDDPPVRGVFCRHNAFFLWRAGKVSEARREGERARALLQEDGDRRELAYVLCDLAASYLDAGELDSATGTLEAALALLRELQYRRVESRSLLLVALARREQGRFDEAQAALDRALQLPVEDGDRGAEGFALWHLACLALERGDAEKARQLGEEALVRYVEMGDGHLIAHARMVLGAALARLGDTAAAESEFDLADALLANGAPHVRDALALFRAHVSLARAAACAPSANAEETRRATSANAEEARRATSANAEETHSAAAIGILRDFDARATGLPLANERFARRVLVNALAAPAPPPREPRPPRAPRAVQAALIVGDDGRWFRLEERREVNLERRAALRRILASLARRRVHAPGTALTLDEVLEAGWPGERVSVEAGAARVYNAIQRLRKLGLESILRTRDDGYLLDADTSTEIAHRQDP